MIIKNTIMENKEEYVAIRLSSTKFKYTPGTRYLLWIDEKWYETSDAPSFVFPKSEIDGIKKLLQKHFIYKCGFVNQEDRTEEVWNIFDDMIPKKKIQSKGLTFKLKL